VQQQLNARVRQLRNQGQRAAVQQQLNARVRQLRNQSQRAAKTHARLPSALAQLQSANDNGSAEPGVNILKIFDSSYIYGSLTSGHLVFNSMTDFANASLTNGSTYAQAFANIGAENRTSYSAGFYGQDEWRVRPNLMVTLALRLDRNSNPSCNGCFTELANQGSFDQIAHSASIPYHQTIRTGLSQVFHSVDPITPEPRLGVAYNLTKSTVLRGGMGPLAY
jgi:type II secretory pathway pseudopilin PulG